MKTSDGIGDTVRDRWEAEDSLVLGLEQVALCHTRILDGLSEGDDDAMKTLKQSIETLECPVDALSNQLGTAVERMMVVERVDKRETGNRGMDGAMELMSGYIQEMISSLDVLKSGVCDISMNDFVENEDWQGHGGHLLRDIAMADCLDENLDLMEYIVIRIVAEAKETALVSMSREDMSAMVKAARMVHVDWIER